ncbi:MAG: tetratricopeptide repeat protein [Nitrospiraceae bacterium]
MLREIVLATTLAVATFPCWSDSAALDSRLAAVIAKEEKARKASPKEQAAAKSTLIEAYTSLLKAQTDKTSRNEALFRRGRLHAEQSNCQRALEDIGEAVASGYRSANAHMVLAYCHRRLGQLEKVREDLDHAIEVAPRDPFLYRERAIFLADKGDNAAALRDASKSIGLMAPNESSDLFVLRGDLFLALGKYEDAIDDYMAAIRISNRNAVELMGSASPRSAQLAPIYEKLSDAYSGLAKASILGR